MLSVPPVAMSLDSLDMGVGNPKEDKWIGRWSQDTYIGVGKNVTLELYVMKTHTSHKVLFGKLIYLKAWWQLDEKDSHLSWEVNSDNSDGQMIFKSGRTSYLDGILILEIRDN